MGRSNNTTSGPEELSHSASHDPYSAIPCQHIQQIQDVQSTAVGCETCLELGDSWVNLRLCMTCGHVGCCESSKNQHALKHHQTTGHPIVRSYELNEEWMWCYVDELYVRE